MGHDHHFLERLDRVSMPQVELALGLYRDAELVRYVLTHVRIPESAERVAISLADPVRGPFIVVARDGGFVTCLGEGMSPAPWPVLTRPHLDAVASKVHALRERLEIARSIAGPGAEAGRILRKIYVAGENLSREDFLGIAAFQPLMATEFLRFAMRGVADVARARPTVLAIRRPRPMDHDLLLAYWRQTWAISHLMLLATMGGHEDHERFAEALTASQMTVSLMISEQGFIPFAVRGAWVAAKLGKVVLPHFKRRFAQSEGGYEILDAGTGLLAIAARHTKLRAEIHKFIGPGTAIDVDEKFATSAELLRSCRNLIAQFAGLFENEGDALAVLHLAEGRKRWSEWTRDLPAGTPHAYANPEDVPEPLARCAALQTMGDLFREPQLWSSVITALPWVARARPEELYLPRAALEHVYADWTPERTLDLVEPHRGAPPAHSPVRVVRVPGRNEPCHCGSGAKYKRCCGAA